LILGLALSPSFLERRRKDRHPGRYVPAFLVARVEQSAMEIRRELACCRSKRSTRRPDSTRMVRGLGKNTLAIGPRGTVPNTILAPSGAIQDIREYWAAGRPFYDPGKVRVPILLIHAEWDVDVTFDTSRDFFSRLTAEPIGDGSRSARVRTWSFWIKIAGRRLTRLSNFSGKITRQFANRSSGTNLGWRPQHPHPKAAGQSDSSSR
jgi:hypothetical protein